MKNQRLATTTGPGAYSTVSTKTSGNQITLLDKESREPGLQRSRFMAKVREAGDDDYVLCIKYNNSIAVVDKNGNIPALGSDSDAIAESEHIFYEPGVNPKMVTSVIGSAPANKMIGNAIVPCGVCLIIGGGGSGKTPLAHAMAAFGVDEYAMVRVGEPLSGYASSSDAAAVALARAILSHDNVVLDSIKDLLSASGGSAMKSGISRDALISISGWATAACEAGCTIYVPVNPSTKDVDVLDLLTEISKSNATMTVAGQQGAVWQYWARAGEGLPRRDGTLTLEFDKSSGVPHVKGDGTVSSVSTSTDRPPIATVVSLTAMTQAMRRSAFDNISD